MAAYVPPHRRRSRGTFSQTTRESDDIISAIIQDCISSIVCINLKSRPDKWSSFQREVKGTNCSTFTNKVTRFDAVYLDSVEEDAGQSSLQWEDDVCREWDATTNAKYVSKVRPGKRTMSNGEIGCALSHIALWRQLVYMAEPALERSAEDPCCMMVLEDDAVFTKKRGKSRFIEAFEEAWKQLPEDWGILYLGFSSRGERIYLERNEERSRKCKHRVRLYKPTYGFHTHAYVISKNAATILLQNLPIQGPIDVFLADNDWFGIPVYCAVIEGEGWRNEDGTYEGAELVSQCRKNLKSDVPQSSDDYT